MTDRFQLLLQRVKRSVDRENELLRHGEIGRVFETASDKSQLILELLRLRHEWVSLGRLCPMMASQLKTLNQSIEVNSHLLEMHLTASRRISAILLEGERRCHRLPVYRRLIRERAQP
jgi:hypothetical protein